MYPLRHLTGMAALLMATALLTASCSSSGTIEEEQVVEQRHPMVFGTSFSSSQEAASTRAPLESAFTDFKVNVWKRFGQTDQQTVMDGYKVNNTSALNWNYVDVNGQPQRYWDLDCFPYEFRAVAPYSAHVSISESGVSLNASSTPFLAQTYIDGTLANVSEPFVVAHVRRQHVDPNYEDYDIIKNTEINTEAKGNAVREVRMPFHHLVSKVGFRIFINDPQPTSLDYDVVLQSIKISVVNPAADKDFVTQSNQYDATNAQGLLNGTFSDNTTSAAEFTLLQHGKYTKTVSGVETEINFRDFLNQSTAFDLCSESSTTFSYLQQIPQENIKVHVVLKMTTDHIGPSGVIDASNEFDFDSWLTLDNSEIFNWAPDTRYIYYLHIPNLHGHEVTLNSCEILPWDEVQTSDISIEL